jgi:hypothetical protein
MALAISAAFPEGKHMSPLWRDGQSIEVIIDPLGMPVSLIWEGQHHAVSHVANHWRVDEGWWLGQRSWREYFKLATATGLLVIVYHDLTTGTWHLQRLYD